MLFVAVHESVFGPARFLPLRDYFVAFGAKRTWPDPLPLDPVARDPLLPSAIQSSCVAVFLFDRLVRAQQDRCRHIEAKRLGGRHVFHRPLHRQVDVGGGAASMAYLVRPI